MSRNIFFNKPLFHKRSHKQPSSTDGYPTGRIEWRRLIGRLSPYTIQKGLRYLEHYGFREFWIRMHERFEPETIPYDKWYAAYKPDEETLKAQRKHRFRPSPLISLAVPAYRTPLNYLAEMISSVQAQTYANWELCIVNGSPEDKEMSALLSRAQEQDRRIRVMALDANRGIAGNTNAALAMARGDYIGLLDHDDALAPNALYEVVSALLVNPGCDCLYTDEDKVTEDLSEHFQPHFKPDFNLDLLRSNNYICHFFVVSRALYRLAGPMRDDMAGAQDYDFIFRCTEKAALIVHVPEILYHWRTHRESTADNPASKLYAYEAGRRAIEGHLARCGTAGTVKNLLDYGFYRVVYPVYGLPLVSIIIPNKDEAGTLRLCLESLFAHTAYLNYEVIIVENNSTTDEIWQYYEELKSNSRIRLLYWKKEFNYSAINNYAASHARGQYLLFLNNDVTRFTDGWLTEMLGVCQRPEVGCVGVKLVYPDDRIQHAGVVVGMGGVAGAMFVDMPKERSGYLHKASLLQDMSAVTAACMMMKKKVFDEAGGFEERLAVAFNDVDLCLKVRMLNYLVVYDPFTELCHMESKTRGAEDSEEKVRRFQREIEYMRTTWGDILRNGDPNYNKNLSLTRWNYSLKPIPGLVM